MRSALPILLAGGTFAGCAIVGLIAGIVAAARFSQPLIAPLGLLLGIGAGAYSAFRLLANAMA